MHEWEIENDDTKKNNLFIQKRTKKIFDENISVIRWVVEILICSLLLLLLLISVYSFVCVIWIYCSIESLKSSNKRRRDRNRGEYTSRHRQKSNYPFKVRIKQETTMMSNCKEVCNENKIGTNIDKRWIPSIFSHFFVYTMFFFIASNCWEIELEHSRKNRSGGEGKRETWISSGQQHWLPLNILLAIILLFDSWTGTRTIRCLGKYFNLTILTFSRFEFNNMRKSNSAILADSSEGVFNVNFEHFFFRKLI